MDDTPTPPPRRKCCEGEACGSELPRRDFVKVLGMSLAGLGAGQVPQPSIAPSLGDDRAIVADPAWPSLKVYDADHLDRIALPLGGIGTGTVSLGGRGDLRDWEIMNRPAKGFVPRLENQPSVGPFFALSVQQPGRTAICRLLEGPAPVDEYEGSHGAVTPNEHFPRFRHCRFAAAYPFGRVLLRDPDVPLEVELRAFNPLVPADAEASGIPIASLVFVLRNTTPTPLVASVAGNLPNFIGMDGSRTKPDWKRDPIVIGAARNRNERRDGDGLTGLLLSSDGVPARDSAWGTLALATSAQQGVSARTAWSGERWGTALLDFWDDFARDGMLDDRPPSESVNTPMASLAVGVEIPGGAAREVTFLLAWHFPNRYSWHPAADPPGEDDVVGNYYTLRYQDAWDVVAKEAPRLEHLRERTTRFVRTFCGSDLPEEVKEAALFNLSTLRTQTCFRTADGRFYGFEGSSTQAGCCFGSCTHVWNYEQATPFLFGELSWSMRDVEFRHATDDSGLMSFRVHLPLARAREYGKAAADGQMGCVMKAYRDWQLRGEDTALRDLWPKVRKALEFCWIPGGWDADRDGVMEGAQHNTMDVEYYGPNPQMGLWYLGALRAAEEMARHLGDVAFATTCRDLFERGRAWIDAHLFNGEYYEHQVRAPKSADDVAPSLLVGMGAGDVTRPDYQLGAGCLVDQLVGQYMAHVCGLGYLVARDRVATTLRSIRKYNGRDHLRDHFNPLRTFALENEAALLMASYPRERPANPFPYFAEVMTGFEYTAAVGMLYEGLTSEGLETIRDVRARYDGRKRNPFDEAECGHHYARAMASWGAVLALTGFSYSAVTRCMAFAGTPGRHFWATGYAWGECTIAPRGQRFDVALTVHEGSVAVSEIVVGPVRSAVVPLRRLKAGERLELVVG